MPQVNASGAKKISERGPAASNAGSIWPACKNDWMASVVA
jgi:hypothetical protein